MSRPVAAALGEPFMLDPNALGPAVGGHGRVTKLVSWHGGDV